MRAATMCGRWTISSERGANGAERRWGCCTSSETYASCHTSADFRLLIASVCVCLFICVYLRLSASRSVSVCCLSVSICFCLRPSRTVCFCLVLCALMCFAFGLSPSASASAITFYSFAVALTSLHLDLLSSKSDRSNGSVEGSELSVIRGGLHTLRRHQPIVRRIPCLQWLSLNLEASSRLPPSPPSDPSTHLPIHPYSRISSAVSLPPLPSHNPSIPAGSNGAHRSFRSSRVACSPGPDGLARLRLLFNR